ncbi:MAG: tetratricopeptide repeat protein [Phocaeicola plebeius]|nr:tetratricopeptide repeat protein [Phocaeicola plebeius]
MYQNIYQCIKDMQLRDAFDALQKAAGDLQDWKLKEEIDEQETTYRYLLKYQGSHDPQREELLRRLQGKLLLAANRARYLHQLRRERSDLQLFKQLQKHTLPELKAELESVGREIGRLENQDSSPREKHERYQDLYTVRDNLTDELFYRILATTDWTEDDLQEAVDLMRSADVPVGVLAVMASAVLLSLIQVFDVRKFQFLVRLYCTRPERMLHLRALLGIVLATYRNSDELAYYPHAEQLFAPLEAIGATETDLVLRLAGQVVMSRQTEQLSQHLNDDLLPSLMQSARYTMTKLDEPEQKAKSLEELEEEMNPEWSKEQEKICNSIMELCELQKEGADTYYVTFKQLRNSRFFLHAPHFFYPFDLHNSWLGRALPYYTVEKGSLLDNMLSTSVFCDSDKYAFALSIGSVSPAERQALTSKNGLSPLMGAAATGDEIQEMEKSQDTDLVVLRNYLWDIYRFIKGWGSLYAWPDLFATPLDFWQNPYLSQRFFTPDTLLQLAEQLMKSGNSVAEAGALFEQLLHHQPQFALDLSLWQKLGYCYQQTAKQERSDEGYKKAIEAYGKVVRLKPKDSWTLKHLAQCHRELRHYEEALDYYRSVLELEPDSQPTELRIAELLTFLGQYAEALKFWFKLEYLGVYPEKAWRGIGWCCLKTDRPADALKYLLRVPAGQLTPNDWLNIGHLHHALHQPKHSIEAYYQARLLCQSTQELVHRLESDSASIAPQIVLRELDIRLLADAIDGMLDERSGRKNDLQYYLSLAKED